MTLHSLGKSTQQIAASIKVSPYQVRYALKRDAISLKRRSGRPSVLSESQVDELEEFICSSQRNRMMTYLELETGPFQHWGISENLIRKVLKKRGYSRHRAAEKPRMTEKSKLRRKEWAEAHADWTVEDWENILWTDETWTSDGRFTSLFVTRTVRPIKKYFGIFDD